MKSQVLHNVWCHISGEAAEIEHWNGNISSPCPLPPSLLSLSHTQRRSLPHTNLYFFLEFAERWRRAEQRQGGAGRCCCHGIRGWPILTGLGTATFSQNLERYFSWNVMIRDTDGTSPRVAYFRWYKCSTSYESIFTKTNLFWKLQYESVENRTVSECCGVSLPTDLTNKADTLNQSRSQRLPVLAVDKGLGTR